MNRMDSVHNSHMYAPWGALDGFIPAPSGSSNSPGLLQPITFQSFQPADQITTTTPHAPTMFSSTNTHHSSNDVVMTDDPDAQHRLQQSAGSDRQPRRVSRRSKYSGLDWEKHKEEIKVLYLENDKSLEQVMGFMKDKHSFAAS
jgi:Clr5 domain